MRFLSKQICTAAVSFLLVAAILAPVVVKLSHALNEHQEQVCKDDSSIHIHEIETDCDFQKFKLSPQYYPSFPNKQKIKITFYKKKDFNHYSFLSKYQKLHFRLRGPPSQSSLA